MAEKAPPEVRRSLHTMQKVATSVVKRPYMKVGAMKTPQRATNVFNKQAIAYQSD